MRHRPRRHATTVQTAGGWILAAAACALASPAHGVAAERPRLHEPSIETVQMVGREALFTTTRQAPHDRTATLLRSVSGDGPRTTVARTVDGSPPDHDLSQDVSHAFETTPSLVAVVRTETYMEPAAAQTDGSSTLSILRRRDGRSTVVQGGCDLHDPGGGPVFAVDGSTLVTAGCGNPSPTPTVDVRRPGAADLHLPQPGPGPGYTYALAVAGDYVAALYADTTDRLHPVPHLLEHRLSTGATVLDITEPGIVSGDGDGARGLAVGRDGTVVGVAPTRSVTACQASQLLVAHPGDTALRPLPARPCAVAFDFDGRRIAYLAQDRDLHVTDLAGNDRLAVRLPTRASTRVSVDGDRAAIAARRCADDALFVVPTTGPTRTLDIPASCPARILSRRLVVRDHHALVRIACPRGCRGYVELAPRPGGPTGRAVDVVLRRGTRTYRVPISASLEDQVRARPVVTLSTEFPDGTEGHETKARLAVR